MTDIIQRYPLSTADGTPIPLEVIRPKDMLRKAFLSGEGSALAQLPAGTVLAILRTTADCFLRFDSVAAIPATDGTPVSRELFVPANEVIFCAVPSLSYSVIGDGFAGTLTIQVIDTWASAASLVSQQRV